ncbi:MAG TPA: MG2 domain-containing protein [Thermoanaerobaculia bacterium]|jgi:hypothetical protein|nr:MG2 domain-containing protein [Thermoanaerobaculia bacterium]
MRVRHVLLSAGGISLVCLTAALLALGACKSGEKVPAKPGAPAPPLTAAALAPVFGTLGPEGVVPRQLVIELARPIAPEGSDSSEGEDAKATTAEGTRLTLQPKVDGELKRTGPSTLVFEPNEPFAPATTYIATLVSVRTAEGKDLRGPGGGWTYRFTTPAFALSRMSLVGSEGGGSNKKDRYGNATVDLVFSAPVEIESVRKRATFTVTDSFGRDAPLAVWSAKQEAANTVRMSVHGEAMRPNRRLHLALAAGAEQEGGPGVATAATDELTLPKGEGVEIKAIFPAEAASGYYVEIVCDDQAALGENEGRMHGHRWYYDRVTGRGFGELSQRCVFPDDELAEKLHVTPAVTFTTAPSGGGMRLFGDFKRGPYSFRLEAGARTADGGTLQGDYETSFSVPARSPQVTFVSKGRYLPRSAWQSLPVRHLNVDEVMVEVRQVPPKNLVFWMSNDDSEAADERTSDLIAQRKIAVHGDPDKPSTTYVDVASWVPADTKGLLEITLTSAGAKDTARLLLTDLQLVAKRTGMVPVPGGDEHADENNRGKSVEVWAFDSKTLAPARGVEISLLRKSGFTLDTCNTGATGACSLQVPEAGVDKGLPFALLASSGRDLTYLKFADLQASVDEARVSGEPYHGGEKKYAAAVYGDRGVYRPGETAHLVAIVRDAEHVAPPAGMPVQVKLVDPRGKVIRQHTLPVNGAGVVTLDPTFAAFAPTGKYEAQVEVAGKAAGSHTFRVEEFVPERMKVEARSAQSQYLLGQEVPVGIEARYLFGGVPEGAKVELSCELAPATFAPKLNANFVYGVWRDAEKPPEKAMPLGAVEGALDDAGKATLACPAVPSAGSYHGPATIVARAAVFEAGSGRTTVGEADVPVHPARYYIGLQSSTQKVKAGSDLVVQGIVVDWNGRIVPNDVKSVDLELVRLEEEYGWYYDENLGEESWRRYLRPVPEDRSKVAVNGGRFTAKWRPDADGSGFLVRAHAGAAHTDLELEGDGGWYYWEPEESEAARTPRPDRPTWIDVSVPDKAKVGSAVEVKFQAPFRGRVLLTAETDELVASEWRDVQPGEAKWTFTLPRFVPNVYVTAFAVKDPRVSAEGGLLPDRAFGVQSLAVEPTDFTQPVKLSVPAEVRSSANLPVTLDLGKLDGPTYATVAAVDEGILSLTRFESPDPAKQIFTRRALGVQTFETIGWTLAVPPASPSRTGGDAAGKLGRVQPVKPVAVWSGLVPVPADGKLRLNMDLPPYRGALRVMAVTAGSKRMGHADAQVIVRDPLVLQVTLPRFLSLGDSIDVPVAVTNLSGAPRKVTVSLAAQELTTPGLERKCPGPGACPPLVAVGGGEQSADVAPNATGSFVFHAKADGGLGGVTLVARAWVKNPHSDAGDLRSEEKQDVPVLPAGPRVRQVQRIELQAGEAEVAPRLRGWLPFSERTTLWVTANPYGEAFGHLRELLHYPYGCIEQTTSTTRPLLYASQLIGTLDPALAGPGAIEKMTQAGIERILSMQTPSGGFGYWPGDSEPTPWGTAYATHVLLDAQRLRYPVPQGRIDDALAWMEQRISNHYERGGKDYDWHAGTSEPYMHYVLAVAGKGRKGRILRLIEQLPNEPRHEEREQLYMLKAALYLAGDHRYERDLRQPDLSPLDGYRENYWTFYSDLRMRGFMLSVFTDLFGHDPGADKLAALVAQGLQDSSPNHWYTTQELAWGITGLGKTLEASAQDFAPPTLTADGRRLAPQPLPPGVKKSDRAWDLPRASEYERLTVNVPTKGEGKLWLILVSEGVRETDGAPYGGEGLKLERRWLGAGGEELTGSGTNDLSEIALGDLVYVELTLHNTSGERMSNIALVDRIPAGWEIENPRLGRSDATPEWVDADRLWQADHMDLRDDRIEVFGELQKGEIRQVIYAVRAVTAGRFELPTADAEAMYDPRNWARVHGGTVEVKGPWAK